MAKLRLVVVGIVCLLTVATTSLYAVPFGEAKVAYKACDKVPSWNVKGQHIWIYEAGDQSVSGASFVREWWNAWDWSHWSSEDQKAWLSGTLMYLFIDAKPVSLKLDICYDQNGDFYAQKPDSVYKIFYLAIPAGRYAAARDFFWVWFGEGRYHSWNDITVTFS